MHKFGNISPGRRVRLVHKTNEAEHTHRIQIKSFFFDCDPYTSWHIPSSFVAELLPAMGSGAFLTGWIRSCTDDEITLDIYQRTLYPLENLNRLLFWTGGYAAPNTFLEIIFSARQMICKEETGPWSCKFRKTTLSFSTAQWNTSVLSSLQKCNLPAWHECYDNTDVCDGEQWEMELHFDNKKTFKIYGSNDYPEEWDLWCRFMKYTLNLKDVKKTQETQIGEISCGIKDF